MKRLLFVFALSLMVQVALRAETRPYYGSTLIGMNRNILQRSRFAVSIGDKTVTQDYRDLLYSCQRKPDKIDAQTIRNLGLAYFLSGEEKYAVEAVSLLQKGIPSSIAGNVSSLIDFLDGVLLLEDSNSLSGHDSLALRTKISALKEDVSIGAECRAVLSFYFKDLETSRTILSSIKANIPASLAFMAEKAGVDMRSQAVSSFPKGKTAKAVNRLCRPELHGTVLSDEEFFLSAINLSYPGLEKVRQDVSAADMAAAKADFIQYLKTRKGPDWYFDWRDCHNKTNLNPNFDRTAADKVAENSVKEVGTAYQFGEVVDWMANPTADKYNEWTWHLSYHDFWSVLKDAYWATGDEKYAEAFVKQLTSWIEQSPWPDSEARVPYSRWRSIETGVRTMNYWPNAFFGFLASPSFDNDAIMMMVKSFYEQALHLRAYYRTHNWLAKEMFGLFTVGIVFPEFRDSQEWCKFASEKMYLEQSRQLYPSGLQTELSPGYHIGTQRNMYGLFKLGKLNHYPFNDDYSTGIEKTYDCMLRSIMPDGRMPAVNDSWWVDARKALSEGLEAFPSRADFKYVVSSGIEGTKPEYTSTWLPRAGWSIMRSGWGKDDLFAFFDVGPFGAGHQHEDKLSLIISAYGNTLLTEGATYSYDTSEWRKYIISAQAHNVAGVDGKDQNRRALLSDEGIKTSSSDLSNRWVDNKETVFAEGWYDEGFGEHNDSTVTQYRALIFVTNKYWVLFDIFTPSDKQEHDYKTWFHLNTENYCAANGLNGVCSSIPHSPNLAIISFREDSRLNVPVGQRDPKLQGWVSSSEPSGYRCVPVATPVFSNKGQGRLIIPYILYPFREEEELPISGLSMNDEGKLVVKLRDGTEDVFSYKVEGSRLKSLTFNGSSVVSNPEPNEPQWDDTSKAVWPNNFEMVSIPSSFDGTIQKAYVFKSTKPSPQPLIVCLHTWSGGYDQKDPLVDAILEKGWNYIHPDFRGPNDNPDAMVSDKVISDIEDAIEYALKNTNADPDNVHIIGASGGGLATLAAYMKVKYRVKSFSAWVPISDLDAWYDESVGRQRKYAEDIMSAIGKDGVLDRTEARRRSPLFAKYPAKLRSRAKLFIGTGIHDGYAGSVPITQSIIMYNRIVGELKYGTCDLDLIERHAITDIDLVSRKEMIELLTKRLNPSADGKTLLGRKIHFQREYKNIRLFIFEGKHEELPGALDLLNIE